VKGENRTFSLDRQLASEAGKKGRIAKAAKAGN
jgi:general stress protein YciG